MNGQQTIDGLLGTGPRELPLGGTRSYYEATRRRPVTEQTYRNCVAMFCPVAREALQAAIDKQSFFLTGIAGSGKSVVLRQIAYAVSKADTNQRVAVTSTTGLSAQNIGGVTIHSWCGMQRGNDNDLTRHIRSEVRSEIRKTSCLIIDEISMASVELLNRVDTITKIVRRSPRDRDRPLCELPPFGGLQVILCGDFFQLSPVDDPRHCFQHPLFPATVYSLNTSRRQGDTEFVDFLNHVRHYDTEEAAEYVFKNLIRELPENPGRTHLMFRRTQVRQRNAQCLADLPGEEYVFFAEDRVNVGPQQTPTEQEETQAAFEKEADRCVEPVLTLKVNARVMYLRNKGPLVNGSSGKVLGFLLNWQAIAIQERSFFHSKRFEDIAKHVRVTPSTPGHIQFKGQKKEYFVPIIRVDKRNHIVFPEFFDCGYGKRMQLPLSLSYAITIHKSQGLSLRSAEVDLRGCRMHGLVYVALSRVRSRDGLRVRNFEVGTFEETSEEDAAQRVMEHFR